MKSEASYNPCRCCQAPARNPGALSRRGLLSGGAAAGLFPALPLGGLAAESGGPAATRLPLKVQPVLVYETPQRAEATSWRNWGAIHTEQDAAQEKNRIQAEIAALASAEVEFLPLAGIRTPEEASKLAQGQDLTVIYAAGGSVKTHEVLASASKWCIMFVRHRSGPVYLWYEIAHPRFLRKTVDPYGQPGMDEQDVVVDSQAELRWRFRALAGLKNTLGKRIVAFGGASGWGAGGRQAAENARRIFQLDIRTIGYPQLGEMIKQARANDALVKKARVETEAYLKQKGTTLETKREFVTNAFLLAEVFQQALEQSQTDCMTINQCMNTIMPMAETTACLPLSLLNDRGYMAFCESDFVVIPSGILLRYISGNPVFMNDPTYPHDNLVTLAHCTAPRKMDGRRVEPARILTHFESDYGAAPKVEMRRGQRVTTIDPDFNFKRWLAFEGEIAAAPFLPICRSQIDVAFKGSNERLIREMKGFHWMTCYGSHARESRYALKKVGIEMEIV